MTSGLPWDEWSYPYSNPNNDWQRMTTSSNWVEFVINRPMDFTPGANWVYNTGGSHLLSAIVHQTTGSSTLSFAESGKKRDSTRCLHTLAILALNRIIGLAHWPQGVEFRLAIATGILIYGHRYTSHKSTLVYIYSTEK